MVQFIFTRILVMYLGRIVEQAGTRPLKQERLPPYPQTLFATYPRMDPDRGNGERWAVMGCAFDWLGVQDALYNGELPWEILYRGFVHEGAHPGI